MSGIDEACRRFVEVVSAADEAKMPFVVIDTARKINAEIIRERTGASRSGVPITRKQR